MALIPEHFIESVVTFERVESNDAGEEQFVPVASGVLISTPVEGTGQSQVWAVTAAHVLADGGPLYLKLNSSSGAKHYALGSIEVGERAGFENFDVQIVPINAKQLRDDGAELTLIPAHHTATSIDMSTKGVAAGDGVFVIGFPLGIAGTERKHVVVRGGVMARFDQELIEEEGVYFVDCSVYPGNSGGLVTTRPSMIAVDGTSAVTEALAIGIVSGFVPYMDVAVSSQTGRPRITFEENSGLARIVPMEAVFGAIEQHALKVKSTGQMDPEPVADDDSFGDPPAVGP